MYNTEKITITQWIKTTMKKMVAEAIVEGLIRIIGEIIIVGIIAILISMGLSEGQANGVLVLFVIVGVYRVMIREKKRRELLGQAVDLDLDRDGKISEEEWVDAEMGENKQEEESEWWSEEDESS